MPHTAPQAELPYNDVLKRLVVHHVTVYRYKNPVKFNEHRLMFRPRDSHDLRLVGWGLTISPKARVLWHHDVFGNSIATAYFSQPAAELVFECMLVVDHYGMRDSEPFIEPFAENLPFTYPADELPDLGRTMERHYPDPERRIDAWARQSLSRSGIHNTMNVLLKMTRAVKEQFTYVRRTEPGVQTPLETLDRGAGTCRDFALFMMEAGRSLGLASRFVSGYLYDPAVDNPAGHMLSGGGSTHAWVEFYIPGAGWLEFDPTNGLLGGVNLLRVAVARDPHQAIPLRGSYFGLAEDFIDMKVNVNVTSQPLLAARVPGSTVSHDVSTAP